MPYFSTFVPFDRRQPPFLGPAFEQQIDRRCQTQDEHGRTREPADQGETERVPDVGVGILAEQHEWQAGLFLCAATEPGQTNFPVGLPARCFGRLDSSRETGNVVQRVEI